MNMRSLSIRRWGVAALAGVTLLGGLSILGESAASAATPTVTGVASATPTISANATNVAAGTETLTLSAVPVTGDTIVLTVLPSGSSCSLTNNVQFGAGSTSAAITGWGTPAASLGACGAGVDNVLTLTAAAGATTTVTIPISYTTVGATSGAVVLSGIYTGVAGGANAGTTSFTLPSNATLANVTVTSNSPVVNAAKSTTTAISNVVLTEPAAGVLTNYVCLALPTGDSWTTTATPTVSVPASAGVTVTAVTVNAGNNTLGFGIIGASTQASAFTLSGLSVTTSSTTVGGQQDLTVTNGNNSSCAAATIGTATAGTWIASTATTAPYTTTVTATTGTFATTDVGDTLSGTGIPAHSIITAVTSTTTATVSAPSQFTPGTTATIVEGPVTVTTITKTAAALTQLNVPASIAGADGTAPGTVAAEFEAAYPAGNPNVVLATGVDPFDALSASYLEGELGTGELITASATSLGADATTALQIMGVQTVYVLGGPLAIAPAVVTALAATPAYNFGGTVQTGKDITVVGGATSATQTSGLLFGPTSDDTAAAISGYFGTGGVPSVNLTGAYSAATSTTGGGLYNDTVGSSSATGPTAGAVPTAIVANDSDFQDPMTASALAFKLHTPVLLTQVTSATSGLGTQASTALTSLGIKQVIVLGGQLAVPNSVVTAIQALNSGITVLRIAGSDGTDTAGQLANLELAKTSNFSGLGWASTGVVISHGDYWSDALGAGALAGGANTAFGTAEPILLTENPTTVGTFTSAILAAAGSSKGIQGDVSIGTFHILGGPLAMPSSTINSLISAF